MQAPTADFLKGALRFFACMTAVSFLFMFVEAWSATAGFVLLTFGVPIAAIVLIVGAGVWAVRGIVQGKAAHVTRERWLLFAATPVLLIITVGLSSPSFVAGAHLGTLSRLMLNWGHYQAIIAKARLDQTAAWYQEDRGVIYCVDVGPPIRVAFNPGGFLDNWSAIVYDPTGDVRLADGWDPATGAFKAPRRVTKLFNGDLVSCSRLLGDFYRCWFT
jgi:hypothetical protein